MMQVRFVRNYSPMYPAGAITEVGVPGGIGRGQFVALKDSGFVEVLEEGPEDYRTAVAVAPGTRGRGRPKGSKNKKKRRSDA
jgi:hypothetical protein